MAEVGPICSLTLGDVEMIQEPEAAKAATKVDRVFHLKREIRCVQNNAHCLH
jgi:hypothetical protein